MKGPIATSLLALSSTVYAASKTCLSDQQQICYSLSIPDTTASSGNGDIFFQISAPTSMTWVALAQGTVMNGANMFVMYTSGDGKNVTISPRTANQHNTPTLKSDTKFELLAGSGVSNGLMIANVKCSTCSDGQSFGSSAGDWVYAWKKGDPINSDDNDASIIQHDGEGQNLKFDYSSAKGGSDANPFTGSSGSTSGTATNCAQGSGSSSTSGSGPSASGGYGPPGGAWGGSHSGPPSFPTGGGYPHPTGYPREKRQDSSDNSCDTGVTLSGDSGGGSLSVSQQNNMLMAHGIMASLAFVILFPVGAIIMRLLSFPGLIWMHAAIQVFAYVLFIIAFGLGVYLANDLDELNKYHPVIGIILFVLVFFQPFLGVLHHRSYCQYKRRTFWSHGHVWLGRIIITLGIINGGLGLLLADNSNSGAIAYGVIAGIVWLVYVVAIVIGERKRARAPSDPPKYEELAPPAHDNRGSNGDVPMEYYGNRHPVAGQN